MMKGLMKNFKMIITILTIGGIQLAHATHCNVKRPVGLDQVQKDVVKLMIKELPLEDQLNFRITNKKYKALVDQVIVSQDNIRLVESYLDEYARSYAGFKYSMLKDLDVIKRPAGDIVVKASFEQNTLSKTVIDISILSKSDGGDGDQFEPIFKSDVLKREMELPYIDILRKALEWKKANSEDRRRPVLYLGRK